MRLAVVSPFLDRSHGTERCIAEQIERFSTQPGAEIHLYAQHVENLRNVVPYAESSLPGNIYWHKVPSIPGPHLLRYLWWFSANHVQRWWDKRIRGIRFDLIYTPGINVLDADAISVHIVFREFFLQVRSHLRFRASPIVSWPRLLHRMLYYRLIMALEDVVYRQPTTSLTTISDLVSSQLQKHFERVDTAMIRYGVDTTYFSPDLRKLRRLPVREALRISPPQFTLLLIGNDWKKKGLTALLVALAECRDLPFVLLVVGTDERHTYETRIRNCEFSDRVQFLKPVSDVLQFYAAADVYVAPSLEDAYGLPILEAMACGLPVIASVRAGASEIIRDGENGLLLRSPEDSRELAELLRRVYVDPDFREKLGSEAAATAQGQTWDRNADATWEFLKTAHQAKTRSPRG